MCLPWLAK
jgi:hypothetical protein